MVVQIKLFVRNEIRTSVDSLFPFSIRTIFDSSTPHTL